MKLIVTILEPTPDAALRAIESLRGTDHDGIEVRAEQFDELDLEPFRRSTGKILILTHRGTGPVSEALIKRAIEAGFDYVDLEYDPALDRGLMARYGQHIVLSHHDYETVTEVESLVWQMESIGAAHTKV